MATYSEHNFFARMMSSDRKQTLIQLNNMKVIKEKKSGLEPNLETETSKG